MKLTPLDIQQQQFRTAFWGFEKQEVDAFLDLLAADVERLSRENAQLSEENTRKNQELWEHKERERTLKETMVTATRMTEEIKENARKEAEIVVAQAELQAEQIIQNAHTRLVRIMEDLDELRRQKAQFEAGLRSTIATHTKLLDAMSERETSEASMLSLVEHRRRHEEQAEREEYRSQGPRPAEDLLVQRGGDR